MVSGGIGAASEDSSDAWLAPVGFELTKRTKGQGGQFFSAEAVAGLLLRPVWGALLLSQ
jgi:hypothetical protein